MATKRGNSEGSIIKRPDGRWEARLTLPGGKRKSFYAKTRQEAAKRLAEATRDRDRGIPIVGERQTVAGFLASWLVIVKPTLALRSWRWYEQIVRVHLIPALGHVALSKLAPQQIQAFYAAKLEEGLSTTTVHHYHATLHRALESAVSLDLVPRNAADRVVSPKMGRHEMSPLSADQSRTFLQAVSTDPMEALYVLALTSGMRQAELLGLKWRDIDLDGAWLQVRATLQKVGGRFIFTAPKTQRSRRRVALTAAAVEALKRHRARQEGERLALGPAWQNNDLVFPNAVGGPMEGRFVLRHYFRPLLKRWGLPPIRFHDLRHTTATLMLSQGIHPKVVSEMLGHTTIGITLDIYSHVLPEMQREAADTLDRLLHDAPDA